jgi:hypothetical protein
VAVRSSIDDIPDEIPAELIPDTLKDLVLNDDGDLVDTKTGKVLNEFGATRFDVAVRAMRGEYDPIGTSTEHEEGSDIGHPHAVSNGVHLPGERAQGADRPGRGAG